MNDLDELKNLLFGAEKQVLDSIQERVQLPEARAADIAAVLPEAVRLSDRENEQLVESLKHPVGKVLRQSFRESPQEFGDALYPVMGPAIRKSIAHTLKAFAQQINQTLEYSLTLKGLSWRLKAARAGIPFASYIIQQSLLYRVEQAYLISRENGLLISHVHHDASHIKDSDAVSAMFTAIQDFVKESFSPDRTGRLETADMGEFTLWAVHGPHALLVCVIRGTPPHELRNDLSSKLEQLHFRYGNAIREYAGDTGSVAGVDEDLQRCLAFEATRPVEYKKKINWPLLIALCVLIGLAAYAAWTSWQNAQRLQQLQTVVDATPGLYVGDIKKVGNQFILHGMRDPLADNLDAIAARAGLDPGQVTGQLRPYQSLDESIRLQRARAALAPAVETRIDLKDNTLMVTGQASATWIKAASDKAAILDLGWPLSFDELAPTEWEQLSTRAAELQNTRLYFASDAELVPASQASLAAISSRFAELAASAANLSATLRITVTGYTDGIGSSDYNQQLADERAAVIRRALLAAGVSEDLVHTERGIPDAGSNDISPELRRASIRIQLNAPNPTTR